MLSIVSSNFRQNKSKFLYFSYARLFLYGSPPSTYLRLRVMKPLICTFIPSALYFSPHRSVSFSPRSPLPLQLLSFSHTCYVLWQTTKGTLTLKHDRATPTPTLQSSKKEEEEKITPVLLYTQCNLGVTFVFYYIFLGS